MGDLVVLFDGTGVEKVRVACLKAADGSQVWGIDDTKQLSVPGLGDVWLCVVGRGVYESPDVIQEPTVGCAGDILPISFVADRNARTSSGIVGVDVRDGRPVWGFRAVADASAERTMVTAVAGCVVLATVSAPYGPQWPDRATTIALDARTGRELWRGAGVIGLAGDGESVVVARKTDGGWRPEVRDAQTGTPRWTGEHSIDGPYQHVATVADHTVLSTKDRRVTDIVRLSTGDQLDFEADAPPGLVGSEPPMLVWDSGVAWWAKGPNGFVTQTLPKGSPTKGKKRPKGLEFHALHGAGPYIWGTYKTTQESTEHDDLAGTIAVDRTGQPRSATQPGVVLADVSEKWLVVGKNGYVEVQRIKPS
ncbi:PQQ-binding-like beta-propeller repeat protein [Kribbella jiaozuonensis]|uniref:PQQ-binding-like beta-propeller repeat protein n=1 Tax=Kribbella jiaozuonensis TaxID=2575441 RepID=UPI00148551CB|nr:PQQ-binding-like beta-propeller repeat protein [Kribbella jiaozuonensis]